ncbi:hypothetical protein WD019_00315 [Fictibacillus sp. Mic-4]|uniref:hypothetical protein n=1 Tax=Fictibacillus TaxID=1329200 RepID=UPI0004245F8E|nr:hypothetical protein [Fictibacillus gelatini]
MKGVSFLMKELIGNCSLCGKAIYCLDGFFNGVYQEDGKIVCFDCFEEIEGGQVTGESTYKE